MIDLACTAFLSHRYWQYLSLDQARCWRER